MFTYAFVYRLLLQTNSQMRSRQNGNSEKLAHSKTTKRELESFTHLSDRSEL